MTPTKTAAEIALLKTEIKTLFRHFETLKKQVSALSNSLLQLNEKVYDMNGDIDLLFGQSNRPVYDRRVDIDTAKIIDYFFQAPTPEDQGQYYTVTEIQDYIKSKGYDVSHVQLGIYLTSIGYKRKSFKRPDGYRGRGFLIAKKSVK